MERPDGISLNAVAAATDAGCVCACVRASEAQKGGVVQGAIKQKVPPGDQLHEQEQSRLGGSLLRLVVRSNWSIRSPTSRPLMAD